MKAAERTNIAERYAEQKHCCSGCAVKRRCSICDAEATTACADCAIDLRTTIYVCRKRECRDAHDAKCPHELKIRISAAEERERVLVAGDDSVLSQAHIALCWVQEKMPQFYPDMIQRIKKQCGIALDEYEARAALATHAPEPAQKEHA